MVRIFLFVVVYFFAIFCGIAQKKVSFIREYIDFALDTNYFSINGIYSFTNNSDSIWRPDIYYPFAVAVHSIDSIRVIDINGHTDIKYNKAKQGIFLQLTVNPCDTVDINIFYRQRARRVNTYILTTTKYWKKPLEIANYSLTVACPLKEITFSFPPDSCKNFSCSSVYYWNKIQFLPETDFSVTMEK
jgi:hypothetical protein